MARRGIELREHILWSAKDVFLEFGFERASMDIVAIRAETSKRSLYAHFTNKENLFLSVTDLVRGLFLGKVAHVEDYPGEPLDALTQFCSRYIEILFYESSVQMLRISSAEAGRFPAQAARYYDALFEQVHVRIGTYIATQYNLEVSYSTDLAVRLLGSVLYPRFARALFGIDRLAPDFHPKALAADFDTAPIREAVARAIASISPIE